MGDVKEIQQLVRALYGNHLWELRQLFDQRRGENPESDGSASMAAFRESVTAFARQLDADDQRFCDRLMQGDVKDAEIKERYYQLLHGTNKPESLLPMPTAHRMLQVGGTHILAGPAMTLFNGQGALLEEARVAPVAVVSSPAATEEGLPRVAQFERLFVEGEEVEMPEGPILLSDDEILAIAPFQVAILDRTGAMLASDDLLAQYVRAVGKIKDADLFRRTAELFVGDFLTRVRKAQRSLLLFAHDEMQMHIVDAADRAPSAEVLQHIFRFLHPLDALLHTGSTAFLSGSKFLETEEGQLVGEQIARLNNASVRIVHFADAARPRQEDNVHALSRAVSFQDIAELVGASGLGAFFDALGHLQFTFENSRLLSDAGIALNIIGGEPFFAPIGVIMLINNIIFQATKHNRGASLTFEFLKPERKILVTYGKGQPPELKAELHEVAQQWNAPLPRVDRWEHERIRAVGIEMRAGGGRFGTIPPCCEPGLPRAGGISSAGFAPVSGAGMLMGRGLPLPPLPPLPFIPK